MNTELDERTKLAQKINALSESDILKLKIFISGMEAAKTLSRPEESKSNGGKAVENV